MPGRKYSSEAYRYDYQGQFAEKDGETGLHSFELRQWDARIARWNSTDPYGQHFSPYMGMGNNPVSLVDPNGGWVKGVGFFKNLFYSDNRINAMNAAGPNGSYFRDPSGGWTANFSDSEGFNIMNFDNGGSGIYSLGFTGTGSVSFIGTSFEIGVIADMRNGLEIAGYATLEHSVGADYSLGGVVNKYIPEDLANFSLDNIKGWGESRNFAFGPVDISTGGNSYKIGLHPENYSRLHSHYKMKGVGLSYGSPLGYTINKGVTRVSSVFKIW